MKNELDDNYDVYEKLAGEMGYNANSSNKEIKIKGDKCDRTDKECIRSKDHNSKKKSDIRKK